MAHGSIKLNKMNTHSFIGIFASNNVIIQVMYLIFILEINFGNKILEIQKRFSLENILISK